MRLSVAVRGRDLVLGYGSSVAIAESTFEIPRGEVTAVIGPNGSGKSTLLNAIAGLTTPLRGSVEVLGEPGARSSVSYVLQTPKVNDSLPVSVKEVVTMGRYARTGSYTWLNADDREAVADAMSRVGITDLSGRRLNDLSGGQRQRVFVAQGLAQDHDILLLDEPLTGIDLPTAQAIDEVIHDEIGRGCTVIMTTHDLSEAQVADNVLLLSGRVVASGRPAGVLTADNLRAAYGAALLHMQDDQLFLDDAAHTPVAGRHIHLDRSIHAESSPTDLHKD